MESPVATPGNNGTTGAMQLYRALERANLLQYYDKFIAQGEMIYNNSVRQKRENSLK